MKRSRPRKTRAELLARLQKPRATTEQKPDLDHHQILYQCDPNPGSAWVEVNLSRSPLVFGRVTIYDMICTR